MTLIEITMAIVVVTILMLTTASAFSSTMSAAGQAKSTTRASIFLQSTMEDLSAQTYAGLLAMNGNTFFDGNGAAKSDYSIDLTVFPTAVDLLQVSVALNDLTAGHVIAEVTTLRANN